MRRYLRTPEDDTLFSILVVGLLLMLLTTVAFADSVVVVFGKTDIPLSSLNYHVSDTGIVQHLICDLESGTYEVSVDGVFMTITFATDLYRTISFETPSPGGFVAVTKVGECDNVPPAKGQW